MGVSPYFRPSAPPLKKKQSELLSEIAAREERAILPLNFVEGSSRGSQTSVLTHVSLSGRRTPSASSAREQEHPLVGRLRQKYAEPYICNTQGSMKILSQEEADYYEYVLKPMKIPFTRYVWNLPGCKGSKGQLVVFIGHPEPEQHVWLASFPPIVQEIPNKLTITVEIPNRPSTSCSMSNSKPVSFQPVYATNPEPSPHSEVKQDSLMPNSAQETQLVLSQITDLFGPCLTTRNASSNTGSNAGKPPPKKHFSF